MSKIDNPFLLYGYEGPEYFCDRKEETEEIVSSLRNGCNITLMSPRRYGKTGLIRHVFHKIKEQDPDAVCFYIDIYATNPVRLRADLRQSRGGETRHTAAKGRKHHHKDIQKQSDNHVDRLYDRSATTIT